MGTQRIGLNALLALLTTVVTPVLLNLSIPIAVPQVLAQTPEARKAEADQLLNQGIEQIQNGQFEAALKSWQQALTIYREIKDNQGEVSSLSNLGFAYYALGNYVRAIEYYQQKLTITQKIKDRRNENRTLNNLGLAYYKLGDYAKAIGYYQQTLSIAREIKDRESEGATLGNLGLTYQYLGDYAKTIEYTQQALSIAREIKDRESEGAALRNLRLTYQYLGDYAKTIEYTQQALSIAREIKDRESEGAALRNLGLTYQYLGDYAKTIEYTQQALSIAREIKDRESERAALGNLGIAYADLGDYAKAIEYQQQALTIAREVKDRRDESYSLGNLGIAYKDLGDYAKAIEYYQQTLSIAREIKDRESEGAALGNLGVTYQYLGDYAKAIEYCQQSLTIAREIKNRRDEGISLGNLGIYYFYLGNYTKAIDYHQQSLTIAREVKDRESEASDLNNLGLSLYKFGNFSSAEKTLIEGIQVYESLRAGLGANDANKISIFEKQVSTYKILQQVLIAQNKPDTALEIAERGRARALVELLATRLSPDQTQPANIAPPTIEQIQQIAKAQKSTLVQYSIIYDEFKIQDKDQWRESELYIWVVKPTGEVTFRKTDLKPLWQQQDTSLEQLVFSTRDSMGVRGRALAAVRPRPGKEHLQELSETERLQQLHKLLIDPIADLLPNDQNAHVTFLPQRALFLVPFPALQDAAGKYLIEKHTILTAPSIQVLGLTLEQRAKVKQVNPQGAIVVGNPTMPSVKPDFDKSPVQLPALPGAEKEALAIAPLLNTQALTGNQATKSAILQLMPQARFIHLATHGLLDDIRGLGSAIALAPSGNDSGLLTAEEILDLKLNAELVVLSACDTGRGKITGDGVVGLSRALITAGVPSVLVSLWSVDDQSTEELMTEFYQRIQQQPDKAQGLRQAMLMTMKKHPQPKYWAAFTLIGESQ